MHNWCECEQPQEGITTLDRYICQQCGGMIGEKAMWRIVYGLRQALRRLLKQHHCTGCDACQDLRL